MIVEDDFSRLLVPEDCRNVHKQPQTLTTPQFQIVKKPNLVALTLQIATLLMDFREFRQNWPSLPGLFFGTDDGQDTHERYCGIFGTAIT
jgi:hypothetical protein